MIGTSDGEQFNTPFEHAISASTMPLGATEKPAGALKTDLGTQVAMDMSRLPESTNIEDRRGYKGPVNGEILRSGNPNQAIDRNTTIVNVNRAARDANDRHEGLDTTETGTAVYGLDPSVAKVLSQPHIAEAIANPKIDRTHDVPYVAGASAKPDDFTTHVDQHIPTTATISGKTFDPAIPLNIHEQVEREVMNSLIKKGMTDEKAYEIAHHEYAEPAEDAWYKAQGIDVKDVNHWWDQQNKVTEKEKSTDLKFPPNLYKKPYPHDEVEGMKHTPANVDAEWATSTKAGVIGDYFHKIFGSSSESESKAPVNYNLPSKEGAFPSKEDAQFAQKSGFAYGKDYENYFNNNIAKVLGMKSPDVYDSKGKKIVSPGTWGPVSASGLSLDESLDAVDITKNIDLQDPKNAHVLDSMKDVFARAALGANRHPLSALGFNPARTLMDVATHHANIGGLTSGEATTRDKDKMYVNQSTDDGSPTIVHEAIHNGIAKVLASDPELKAEFKKQGSMFEEHIVRHIMDTVMGNPEEGAGKGGDDQIKESRVGFRDYSYYKKITDKLTAKAQEIIGKQKGPK